MEMAAAEGFPFAFAPTFPKKKTEADESETTRTPSHADAVAILTP